MNTIRYEQFLSWLKPRQRKSHKGHFGHVLVVGGARGFSGAVYLAAEAAMRAGAGAVSVALETQSPTHLCPTEIMAHFFFKPEEILSLCTKATVYLIGPGLGLSDWSQSVWYFFQEIKLPSVIDADGLNCLANHPTYSPDWILTPHPGEAARLLKTSVDEIQKNRESSVIALQKKYGGVVVLKGAGTLIATEKEVVKCEAGNPGMSSAGMGDVLSGVIAGLLAQHLPLEIAAKLGVLIHAMAGDLAKKNGERGMLASDLFPYLRQLANLRD